VGYQGITIDDMIDLLRENGVQRVIDVREAPISHKPGFSKRRLSESLEAAGIAYDNRRILGTPRWVRERQRAGADAEWLAQVYNEHLDSVPDAMDELADDVTRETCCLLCFEADPERCHRRLIVARLNTMPVAQSLTVHHLRAAPERV